MINKPRNSCSVAGASCTTVPDRCRICKNFGCLSGASLKYFFSSGSEIKCSCDGGDFVYLLRRIPLFAIIVFLAFFTSGQTLHAIHEAMADAYIAVSSFVAVTLFVFYFLGTYIKIDRDKMLDKYRHLHVPIASLIGVLPGCGGAIIVITQYVCGKTGFASVVAVLASTMGDAAFLLLAQEPKTALLVYLCSLVAGVVSGYAVEIIHGKDFLRQFPKEQTISDANQKKKDLIEILSPRKKMLKNILITAWILLIIPGFALGVGNVFQADTKAWFDSLNIGGEFSLVVMIGVAGALLCCFTWVIFGGEFSTISYHKSTAEYKSPNSKALLLQRVVADTSFVTVWVIVAFIAYELLVLWLGLDLKDLFDTWSFALPFIGVLIGFIPGCAPQILVTTAYLNGLVPLSVQLGNAISNDGDALFPAIAMAPKAAFVATIYTAVPALIISYGWLFLFE